MADPVTRPSGQKEAGGKKIAGVDRAYVIAGVIAVAAGLAWMYLRRKPGGPETGSGAAKTATETTSWVNGMDPQEWELWIRDHQGSPPRPDHDCPRGHHWDAQKKRCVSDHHWRFKRQTGPLHKLHLHVAGEPRGGPKKGTPPRRPGLEVS